MRVVYLILICFAAPVAAFVAWLRGLRDPSRRERLADRFGRPQLSIRSPILWVHAASMGEVQAAAILVRRLLNDFPRHEIVMTTMTATGGARVKALFPQRVTHCFLPYDLPFAVRGFFARARPELAIIFETELWPNLLGECRRRGVRVVIASARISPRTADRYRRFRSLFRDAFVDAVVAAQTSADAERFKTLNAIDVRVMGNIKFDIEIPAAVREAGTDLRKAIGSRFVWVAGSTHPGEEEAALSAHQNLIASSSDALLVLVPRHPARFSEVRQLLERGGSAFVVRSTNAPVTSAAAVLLVDTMGELLNFYAAADVAFVGGSLAPIGGHNVLEPAALGLPILCGPNTSSNAESVDALRHAGALTIVQSAAELAQCLLELSGDQALRKSQGQKASAVVAENRGAIERLAQIVAPAINH